MRIIAVKSQVESLPDWVREFLEGAWSPPNENGQRAAISFLSDEMEPVVRRFASMMDEEMAKPGAVSHRIAYALVGDFDPSEGIRLAPVTLYNEWHIRVAAKIMEAWNERSTLATCTVCGSLMQPGKGRVARTCSDACRLKLHREGRKA